MFHRIVFCGLGLISAAGSLAAIAGCGTSGTPNITPPVASSPPAPPAVAPGAEQHAHLPGAHGGIIVPIGRDAYHAEAVFEKGGTLRLHTLGRDEARVEEVAWQTLTAYVKAEGDTEATAFQLDPKPQPDDSREKTSAFVGQIPPRYVGQRVEVTIPSIRIGSDRFRLGFKSADESAHAETMPDALADEEARKLFLTPGGAYTEDDIAANGRQTAARKFRAFVPTHDLFPKAGDRTCPITLTKANPKCTWVVGGKTYEFCCPPCVEEFVKLAKNQPEKVQDPDQYVKRVEAEETTRR